MARPLRIELSGGLHHITSRGDRREDIYFSDIDREAWLALLGQVCARFNGVCQAYCLMSNHYHLVIETPEGNLARGMRQLNGVYTQMVNRTHGRVGHVFQGRYQAILVEKDSYLLALACRAFGIICKARFIWVALNSSSACNPALRRISRWMKSPACNGGRWRSPWRIIERNTPAIRAPAWRWPISPAIMR